MPAAVMSARLWKRLPQTITVRQVRVPMARPGFRTQSLLLITTRLEPSQTLPIPNPPLRRIRINLRIGSRETVE